MRHPPRLLLTASVAMLGSNARAPCQIAVSGAAGFPGATAADAMRATAPVGGGTALGALVLGTRTALARALFAAV